MMRNSEFDDRREDTFHLQDMQRKFLSSQEQMPQSITHIYSYDSSEDFEEQEQSTKQNKCCPELNRNLIVYKTFYFLFFGAVGALFPYLAVFYKQLWLSAHQVGILIGLRPFIQMIASPFWGVLADTYNVSKPILLMSIGAWLVSNFSISMVKPNEYEPTCDLNLTYMPLSDYMDEEEVHWPRIETLLSKKDNITYPDDNRNYNDVGMVNDERFGDMNGAKGENKDISSLYAKGTSRSFYNVKVTGKTNNHKGNETKKLEIVLHNSKSEFASKRNGSTIMKLLRTMFGLKRKISKMHDSKTIRRHVKSIRLSDGGRNGVANSSANEKGQRKSLHELKRADNGEPYKDDLEPEEYLEDMTNQNVNGGFYSNSLLPNQRVIANEDLKEEFDSLKAPNGMFWPLDDKIDVTNTTEARSPSQIKEARNLFNVLIAITICGTILSSPAATLADTATLQALGDDKYRYGQQRLWGAFGWGLGAFIVGAVVSIVQEIHQCADPKHIDYILSFYVYAFIMGLAFICALFFRFEPVSETAYKESFWEAVKMFTDCQHICFIMTLLCSGTAMGFTHTFLFWHLHDMGGSQFLFSIVAAVQCISEVFMYLVSGYLILKIGCDSVLYIGLLANVIRLFAYSVITQPVFSVLLEVLQGVSSASIWTAAICYVGLNPGVQVTLQAILHGIYWGLGHGGGGMLGGLVVTYFGSNATFIIFGIICVINLLTLFLMKYWNKFLEQLGSYTSVENIPAGTYILIENREASK